MLLKLEFFILDEMSVVEYELQDIRNYCEHQIEGSSLITCVSSLVQVSIKKTKHKQLTACIQFPTDYPKYPLLVELKSRTLSKKFVNGLTNLCDSECQKILGKPQVLKILKFLRNFLDENPLCICNDEIAAIKRALEEKDELRLKQKSSTISLLINKGQYFIKLSIFVPDLYPEVQISIENKESNFPRSFHRWFVGQATEIARQQVEKPLKPLKKESQFEPKISLKPAVMFIIEEVKRYPSETCSICDVVCFPSDPKECIQDPSDSKCIERVYCGHIFHNGCLDSYMKTPPFTGGKKCPRCKQRIFHEKWKTAPKLAEDKWAHHEAKKRELGEVVEFFE